MKIFLYIVLFLFVNANASAQGKLLLVGGGGEKIGGWSDAPYEWFVDQAENKKIAIISYDAGSDPDWLVNYFESLGAVQVKNFEFRTRASAEVSAMYDSLMKYDGIFFKGGDQWYYDLYMNDTPVEKAVADLYAAGGVIGGTSAGMAILGQYCYTAENGSLTADEALADIFDPNITITDDFMPLLPGYITDTHFMERGRLPRIIAMQGNYLLTEDVPINGIACDDQTAVTIDATNQATVYGNGGAYIYKGGVFSETNGKWSGNTTAIHLSERMSINLTTFDIDEGPDEATNANLDESANTPILLCGDSKTDEDSPCVMELAAKKDTMMILTGESRIEAALLLNSLKKLGKTDVFVLSAVSENNDEALWKLRNKIRRTKNVVFIDNDFDALFEFLNGGPTGELINEHIRRNDIFNAFMGEDSKLAGAVYCSNNLQAAGLSYAGDLEYADGLALLSNTILIPDPYSKADEEFFENNTLSGLFALSEYDLAYGIYVSGNSMINFESEEGINYFSGNGEYSAMILKNTSAFHQNFDVPTGSKPRNNASFDQLEIHFLNENNEMAVGETIVTEDYEYEFEKPEKVITGLENEIEDFLIYPTVTNDYVNITSGVDCIVQVISPLGITNRSINLKKGTHAIRLGQPGLYILHTINSTADKLLKSQRIVKY